MNKCQIFRLNFSLDISKIHYFCHKFLKIALIFDFGNLTMMKSNLKNQL